MPRFRINVFQRELGTIWKFVGIVAGVILVIGSIAGVTWAWMVSVETRFTEQATKLDGLQSDFSKLERQIRFHERGHK